MADGVSMIFFRSGSSDLGIEAAERLLVDRGLHVVRDANVLTVRWADGPELSVVLSAGSHVREEAVEIGVGTAFAAGLSRCDARFEFGIEDLDEVLDESNT